MLAQHLISAVLPPLAPSNSVKEALNWMDDYHLAHLPVVENGKLLEVIAEETLLAYLDNQIPLSNVLSGAPTKAFVHADDHLYEVIKAAVQKKLTVVPVVDAAENWFGMITLETLLQHFAESGSLTATGSIIVLEMAQNDYSLGTIARITEAEGVHILSSYITSRPDDNLLELTLKLDTTEIQRVVATYERFKYTVKAAYDENDYFDSLKSRYDSLMSYLNV